MVSTVQRVLDLDLCDAFAKYHVKYKIQVVRSYTLVCFFVNTMATLHYSRYASIKNPLPDLMLRPMRDRGERESRSRFFHGKSESRQRGCLFYA